MPVVTNEMIADAPPPVRRSLLRSGVVGRQIPTTVSLRQRGEILLRDRWFPFAAAEEYRLPSPWFEWKATVGRAGLPIARATDSFDGLHGKMRVKLFGLIRVVDAAGFEMDQGALMRWLNETMWFPQVWATEAITWTSIDDTSAVGAVTGGDLTVEAEFRFDGEGRLIDFHADRYESIDSGFRLSPWSTPLTEHSRFDGIEVPSYGSALWHHEDKDLEYIRIGVTDVAYR